MTLGTCRRITARGPEKFSLHPAPYSVTSRASSTLLFLHVASHPAAQSLTSLASSTLLFLHVGNSSRTLRGHLALYPEHPPHKPDMADRITVLRKLKVPELKAILKAMDKTNSGKKDDLIDRIIEAEGGSNATRDRSSSPEKSGRASPVRDETAPLKRGKAFHAVLFSNEKFDDCHPLTLEALKKLKLKAASLFVDTEGIDNKPLGDLLQPILYLCRGLAQCTTATELDTDPAVNFDRLSTKMAEVIERIMIQYPVAVRNSKIHEFLQSFQGHLPTPSTNLPTGPMSPGAESIDNAANAGEDGFDEADVQRAIQNSLIDSSELRVFPSDEEIRQEFEKRGPMLFIDLVKFLDLRKLGEEKVRQFGESIAKRGIVLMGDGGMVKWNSADGAQTPSAKKPTNPFTNPPSLQPSPAAAIDSNMGQDQSGKSPSVDPVKSLEHRQSISGSATQSPSMRNLAIDSIDDKLALELERIRAGILAHLRDWMYECPRPEKLDYGFDLTQDERKVLNKHVKDHIQKKKRGDDNSEASIDRTTAELLSSPAESWPVDGAQHDAAVKAAVKVYYAELQKAKSRQAKKASQNEPSTAATNEDLGSTATLSKDEQPKRRRSDRSSSESTGSPMKKGRRTAPRPRRNIVEESSDEA